MKTLPVIQNPQPAPAVTPSELQTAGMIDDPARAAELRPLIVAAGS